MVLVSQLTNLLDGEISPRHGVESLTKIHLRSNTLYTNLQG